MMKKLLAVVFVLILILGFSLQAQATLELRGEGTSAYGTHRLIYDTDLNITWYDYTNSVNSQPNQVNWASGLTVNFGGTIYDDWRLPLTVDGPSVWGYNGTTTSGWNITSSEMGHLFYTELGNIGQYDISGNIQTGYGLSNKGPFTNLLERGYWSTEYAANTEWVWGSHFLYGNQDPGDKVVPYYAIAVRSGDVAVVPEPISSILFLTGGATLIGRKYIRRRKKKVYQDLNE